MNKQRNLDQSRNTNKLCNLELLVYLRLEYHLLISYSLVELKVENFSSFVCVHFIVFCIYEKQILKINSTHPPSFKPNQSFQVCISSQDNSTLLVLTRRQLRRFCNINMFWILIKFLTFHYNYYTNVYKERYNNLSTEV